MRQQLTGPHRDRAIAEARAARKFRRECQVLKDRLDLFGEEALTEEERIFVQERPAFFYPGRRE